MIDWLCNRGLSNAYIYIYIIYIYIWDYDRAWAEMGTVLKHPAYVVKGWSWMMTENIYLNISQKPQSHEYIQHQTMIYGRYSLLVGWIYPLVI